MNVFTWLGISMGLMFGAMMAAWFAPLVGVWLGRWGFAVAVAACLLLGVAAVFGGWALGQVGYYGS